jgi:hypothetical protein
MPQRRPDTEAKGAAECGHEAIAHCAEAARLGARALAERKRERLGCDQQVLAIEITAEEPEERLDWECAEGVEHAGVISFHPLAPRLTRLEEVAGLPAPKPGEEVEVETRRREVVEEDGERVVDREEHHEEEEEQRGGE